MKLKTILLWICIALALLVVVALILFKSFVSPANVEAIIVPRLEKILDRDVTVGSTELKIFPTVTVRLHDLDIANKPPFAGHSFGKISSIDASLSLFPLLLGNIRVNQIKVVNPMLGIQIDSSGVSNFDFLRQLKQSATASEPHKSSPICNSLVIESGRLLYKNDSTGTRLAIGGLSAKVHFGAGENSQIELSSELDSLLVWSSWGDFLISRDAVSINLEAIYNQSADSFTVKTCDWKLDKMKGRLDGGITTFTTTPNLDIRAFSDHNDLLDFYDSKILDAFGFLKDVKLSGDLRADVTYKGMIADKTTANVHGKVTISNLVAKFPDANSDFKSKLLECNFNEQSLSVFAEEPYIGPDPAQLRIAVENYRDPTISGEIKLSCDAGFLGRFAELGSKAQLSGKVDLALSGFIRPSQSEQARLFGSLQLANTSFSDPEQGWSFDTLNLACSFSGNDADISNFDITRSGNRLQLTGKILGFTPYLAAKGLYQKHPQFTFSCTSDSFDFASFTSSSAANDTSHIQRVLDYLCDFDASGSLKVKQGLVLGIPFENLTSHVATVNHIIHSDSTFLELMSGKVDADIVIDMSQITSPEYDIDVKCEDIHSNDLLMRFTPLKDLLDGKCEIQASFKSRGTSAGQALSNLTGSGKVTMDDGKIGELELSKVFSTKYGVDGIAQEDFDDLAATFKIASRTLTFAPLNFKRGKVTYLLEGGIGFDGNLDCRVTRSISKDDAKALFALPEGTPFATTKSPARAVFIFTGNGNSPSIQLQSIISKD